MRGKVAASWCGSSEQPTAVVPEMDSLEVGVLLVCVRWQQSEVTQAPLISVETVGAPVAQQSEQPNPLSHKMSATKAQTPMLRLTCNNTRFIDSPIIQHYIFNNH
jgi:hypothetical protein